MDNSSRLTKHSNALVDEITVTPPLIVNSVQVFMLLPIPTTSTPRPTSLSPVPAPVPRVIAFRFQDEHVQDLCTAGFAPPICNQHTSLWNRMQPGSHRRGYKYDRGVLTRCGGCVVEGDVSALAGYGMYMNIATMTAEYLARVRIWERR